MTMMILYANIAKHRKIDFFFNELSIFSFLLDPRLLDLDKDLRKISSTLVVGLLDISKLLLSVVLGISSWYSEL